MATKLAGKRTETNDDGRTSSQLASVVSHSALVASSTACELLIYRRRGARVAQCVCVCVIIAQRHARENAGITASVGS